MGYADEFTNERENALGSEGFVISERWYHGTSSALLPAIKSQGLIGSGDQFMQDAAAQTLSTIGDQFTASKDPIFLTPCKELAQFWAEQTVTKRKLRTGESETPAVITLSLPPELQSQVKPDVGATSLLLLDEGKAYLDFVEKLYSKQGIPLPSMNLQQLSRELFLTQLGLAYIKQDIHPDWIRSID